MSHTPDAKTTVKPTDDSLRNRIERGNLTHEQISKEFERRRYEKQMDKEQTIKFPAPKGWECPNCGRVNAPFVSQCPCWVAKPAPTWVPVVPPNNPGPWHPAPTVPDPWRPPYYPYITCNGSVAPPCVELRMVEFGG